MSPVLNIPVLHRVLSKAAHHIPRVFNMLGLEDRNTALVSSGVSLTSWGEGASLALVGHPSSDAITIKIAYGVDVLLRRPASLPIFSYWVG